MQHQNQQKSVIDQLAELLNITPKQLLVAIREMKRDPNQAQLSWKDAITNHLSNPKNPVLPSSKPEPSPPESFSLDEDDLMEWGELEEELGQGVLVLAEELGIPTKGKLSIVDAEVLRELTFSSPVHEAIGEKIVAAEGLQEGFAQQHIQNQREMGYAIANAGSLALTGAFFQGRVEGLEQIAELNQTLHDEILNSIGKQVLEVGTEGKGQPNQTVAKLGKKTIKTQKVREKKEPLIKERFNLKNIRAYAKK